MWFEPSLEQISLNTPHNTEKSSKTIYRMIKTIQKNWDQISLDVHFVLCLWIHATMFFTQSVSGFPEQFPAHYNRIYAVPETAAEMQKIQFWKKLLASSDAAISEF